MEADKLGVRTRPWNRMPHTQSHLDSSQQKHALTYGFERVDSARIFSLLRITVYAYRGTARFQPWGA
jgi:hypothetical protein